MAFSDWTFHNGTGFTPSLETVAPILGAGSLKWTRNTAASATGAHGYLTAGPKGFTHGRIRTLFQVISGFPAQIRLACGIVAMQSQLDVSATGSAYVCVIGRHDTSDHRLVIAKTTAGIDAAMVPSGLAFVNIDALVANDIYPLEFEWHANVSVYGGTRLLARLGTKNSTDFGTLATIIELIDITSPLTSTVGEGVCAIHGTSTGTAFVVLQDNTEIYEMI